MRQGADVSEVLLETFLGPLRETFFQKALIGGAIAAIVCSVVGCLVILRRMAFLGDALSHAMIAGVAAGYLFMKLLFNTEAHAPAMLLGSLIAALITVASIGFVSRFSRVKDDTAIGIMYTGVFAAGVVLVSIFRGYIHIDLMHFIMGDVLGVADSDLWVAAVSAGIVLSIIVLFFRQFQLTSFDPVMAASIGMPVLLIDYTLTTCVSLVVVSAVSMVGVILVVGLLITPAASAYLLSDRLDRMMILAAIFGVTSVVGGLYLSMWLDSSGGGAIMLFCSLQFIVVLVLAPNYGLLSRWLRLRQMAPQQTVEDMLVETSRSNGVINSDELRKKVSVVAASFNRALKKLSKDGLLEIRGATVALTESGAQEAARILRAHRLWEAYMSHVGLAANSEIHARAHELEHLHDNESVDYLDDLLGHPVYDPHGSVIPQSGAHCAIGGICSLSFLREGTKCEIISAQEPEAQLGLTGGMKITVGPRSSDQKTWTVVREDGSEIALNHKSADSIEVRIVSISS